MEPTETETEKESQMENENNEVIKEIVDNILLGILND